MDLLVISRDQNFIARIQRAAAAGTIVMVISQVGRITDRKVVPASPDVVVLDLEAAGEKWHRVIFNLRKSLNLKVIAADRRGNWRREHLAIESYAIDYLSKARRTTNKQIWAVLLRAYRVPLPVLPLKYL